MLLAGLPVKKYSVDFLVWGSPTSAASALISTSAAYRVALRPEQCSVSTVSTEQPPLTVCRAQLTQVTLAAGAVAVETLSTVHQNNPSAVHCSVQWTFYASAGTRV